MSNVHTISKETIKPSSPTPQHLNSIQLSQLDQTSPQIYTHILLVYSTNSPETPNLKSSLSLTLNHFYPFAGRIRPSEDTNTLHVYCNDEGVEFIEAQAEAELDSFLLHPPIDQFPDLLPIKSSKFRISGDPLLAVQFNTFKSGKGFALGISFSHLIADGASMVLFLNCWADIARGELDLHSGPRFDSALVFPPRPQSTTNQEPTTEKDRSPPSEDRYAKAAIKRFLIDGRAIERLRGSGSYDRAQAPTRVEAVSALMWRCLNRARGRGMAVSHAVDLRKKMGPLLSENSIGNLWINAVASCSGGGQGLAEEAIRDAVRKVDEEYVRRLEHHWGEGGDCWTFSSWCRMPWYRIDFGWGEPAWFGCGLRDMRDVCILIDTKDGGGIEVWLWLEREEMNRVERDEEFLHFVSSA